MNEEFRVKKWGGENAAEFINSPKNIIKDYKGLIGEFCRIGRK